THVALPVTSLVANPGNSRIQPLALSPLVKIKESGEEDDLCPDGSLRKKSADSTSKIAKGLGLYATEGFRFPVSDLDGPLQRKLKDTWGASRSYRKGIHLGVDIYVPEGRQVVAITDGKVVSLRPSETKPGGNIVFVRDSGGYLWGYMHLKGYAEGLRKRQRVSAGTPLGKSGRTGIQRSDPHLHVDVRKRIPKDSAETAPANEFRMRVPKAKKKYDYEYVNIFSLLKHLDKQRQGHKVDDDGCP
ncbi:MAG: M23 family metallopeptidase, partial [Planctomycetota bacterium]